MRFDQEFPASPLYLFNTQSRRKEQVKPIQDNTIRLYTCGPTVYDFAHIGNFRTFIMEDILRRTIKYFGMNVQQAMNLTDVDDKTIRGAIVQQVSLNEFTRPYKEAFFQDLKTLNIEEVEFYPSATDFIGPMIKMVQALVERGIAYQGQDASIYFDIRKFPHYGCLSHFKLEELESGASERVSQDEYAKEHASDFVLWKAYEPVRDGTVFWDSPFGRGRPGWHLECSVMAHALLGETIDIHAGGVDLIFPHHENEVAQSESFTCKTFSRLWMHVEHLLVDHKKMSKSLGNFYTLRALLEKGYEGNQLRFLFLQTHYRIQLNFTLHGLDAARSSLQRIADFISRLQEINSKPVSTQPGASKSVSNIVEAAIQFFNASLADDLNTAQALGALFDLIRQGNILCDMSVVSAHDAAYILQAVKKMNTVFGFMGLFDRESGQIPGEVEALMRQRHEARVAKNWKESDSLRSRIEEKGYLIEDSPEGTRLKKKSMR